jgi:hypothetical protein
MRIKQKKAARFLGPDGLGCDGFVPSIADGRLQIEPVIMINYPNIHYQVLPPSVNPNFGTGGK